MHSNPQQMGEKRKNPLRHISCSGGLRPACAADGGGWGVSQGDTAHGLCSEPLLPKGHQDLGSSG